jgi:trigger factor
MEYTIERLPESQVAVDVELESERVEKALNQASRRIARKVRIPGFRPGKAPRSIVEARFGRASLYEEAIDELVREAYREILGKEEFNPVAEAELDVTSLEPFAFRLTIPVYPTITLGDYQSLRFAEEVGAVTDEDVAAVLERLQAEQTMWQTPDPPRPAELEDRLTADLVGRTGENEFEQRSNVQIALVSEAHVPGFAEGLVGAEIGQTVEVNVTLPEDLEEEALAGQEATYSVTIHDIKEPEVPPLDDDFAVSFGQEDTLEEMRARIRQELEEAEEQRARGRVLDQMVEAIVEGAETDIPQVLVHQEAEGLFESQETQLRRLQISMPQFFDYTGKSEEEFREELRETALERVRRSLVLQEFASAEDLAEQEDLAEKLEDRLLSIARGEMGKSEAQVEPEHDEEASAAVADAEPPEGIALDDEPGPGETDDSPESPPETTATPEQAGEESPARDLETSAPDGEEETEQSATTQAPETDPEDGDSDA